jgi:hypothetical protein
VTSVGEVAKTREPEPVSSVTAAAKLDEEGVARKEATLVPSPDTPVAIGRPVALVSVPEEGVPRAPPLTTNAPADPVLTPKACRHPCTKCRDPRATGGHRKRSSKR